MTRQIKAQRQATVIRKEEIKQSIINATVGILAGLVGIGLIIALVYALLWKDGQL
jgi:tetrahydromethanopterin S-methyltransferase subunit G